MLFAVEKKPKQTTFGFDSLHKTGLGVLCSAISIILLALSCVMLVFH